MRAETISYLHISFFLTSLYSYWQKVFPKLRFPIFRFFSLVPFLFPIPFFGRLYLVCVGNVFVIDTNFSFEFLFSQLWRWTTTLRVYVGEIACKTNGHIFWLTHENCEHWCDDRGNRDKCRVVCTLIEKLLTHTNYGMKKIRLKKVKQCFISRGKIKFDNLFLKGCIYVFRERAFSTLGKEHPSQQMRQILWSNGTFPMKNDTFCYFASLIRVGMTETAAIARRRKFVTNKLIFKDPLYRCGAVTHRRDCDY